MAVTVNTKSLTLANKNLAESQEARFIVGESFEGRRRILGICSKFRLSQNGNVGILFAALAPVLIGMLGAAIDFAQYNRFRSDLQSIADSAAIAGARYYTISGANKKIPLNVAKDVAVKKIDRIKGVGDAMITSSADKDERTVLVDIKYAFTPTFLTALIENPLTIKVSSQAQSVGVSNTCLIALSDNKKSALLVADDAQLSGVNCAVYSNSTHKKGIQSEDRASVDTVFNCSSGGFRGRAGSFVPAVIEDCPPRDDPLVDFIPPPTGHCARRVNFIANARRVLDPGVYCFGLHITGNSVVTLRPGIYVIKNSSFTVQDTAKIKGEGVSFYFIDDASMDIGRDTTVEFTAPEVGPMAGILMFQERSAPHSHKYKISSNNARTMVGTLYFPSAKITIDADQPVAVASAYTAILAEEIEIKNSGVLVLNSDYEATNVPVPDGLAGGGGTIRLRN